MHFKYLTAFFIVLLLLCQKPVDNADPDIQGLWISTDFIAVARWDVPNIVIDDTIPKSNLFFMQDTLIREMFPGTDGATFDTLLYEIKQDSLFITSGQGGLKMTCIHTYTLGNDELHVVLVNPEKSTGDGLPIPCSCDGEYIRANAEIQ